jgi:hypothetical protein
MERHQRQWSLSPYLLQSDWKEGSDFHVPSFFFGVLTPRIMWIGRGGPRSRLGEINLLPWVVPITGPILTGNCPTKPVRFGDIHKVTAVSQWSLPSFFLRIKQ